MTLKQKNNNLTEELQKAKDKIVNLQTNLKDEQLKRFDIEDKLTDSLNTNVQLRNELLQATKDTRTPNEKRLNRKEGSKRWQQ